jgi:biotin carboxyl carrier protein
MLPNSEGLVRVRSNIAGEVEIRAAVGQVVWMGQSMAVVEGDHEIESLSVRKTSEVMELLVEDGTEVESGTTIMVVREISE